MKIKIIKSHKNAHRARGLTVVIDVLRAFTTASFILDSGAVKIISVAGLETAYKLKKDNPDYVLVGERGGLSLDTFDFLIKAEREDGLVNLKNIPFPIFLVNDRGFRRNTFLDSFRGCMVYQ